MSGVLASGRRAALCLGSLSAAAALLLGCHGPGRGPLENASNGTSRPALVSGPGKGANARRSPVSVGDPPAAPAAPVELRHPRSNEPWLGVSLKGAAEGVLIERVLHGSPAEQAGLLTGDLIVELGAQRMQAPADVMSGLEGRAPRERVSLGLLRGTKTIHVKVELAEEPHAEDLIRLQLVGRRAPEISGIVTFQGDVTSLRDVRGRVLVLEFWASYCPPCRFIAPVLDRWYNESRARGLVVLGVTSDSPLRGAEIASRHSMTYPLAAEGASPLVRNYWATQIPLVVLIDRRTIVRDVVLGYDPARLDELEREVENLLEEQP